MYTFLILCSSSVISPVLVIIAVFCSHFFPRILLLYTQKAFSFILPFSPLMLLATLCTFLFSCSVLSFSMYSRADINLSLFTNNSLSAVLIYTSSDNCFRIIRFALLNVFTLLFASFGFPFLTSHVFLISITVSFQVLFHICGEGVQTSQGG